MAKKKSSKAVEAVSTAPVTSAPSTATTMIEAVGGLIVNTPTEKSLAEVLLEAVYTAGHAGSCPAVVHVDESKCVCWLKKARALLA